MKSIVELQGAAGRAYSDAPETEAAPVAVPVSRAPAGRPRPGEQPAADKARRRVLVVDDNVDSAISLAMILRLLGHEVRVAHDGPSGIRQAQDHHPEIAFLDLGMPGMSGYEVARHLRQDPQLQPMRLIAITGWGQQEDRRRTKEAGFDYHVVKPVEPETLERLLEL